MPGMENTLRIRECTIAELEASPNLPALLEEYAQESALAGLPHPSAKIDMYKVIEATGVLKAFAALIGDELIGFVHVMCAMSPKYGIDIAQVESIFVTKPKRSTGAGNRLLRVAADHAKERGAAGIIVTALIGSTLDEVLDNGKQYIPVTRSYFMELNA